MEGLKNTLRRIDGRGYRAYQDLRGEYQFDGFRLFVDHVQGDPFAAPSRIALSVSAATANLPESLYGALPRRIATEDYLTRCVATAIPRLVRGNRGSGKSGRVSIDRPGQEVLERTSTVITDGAVEVRLQVGLPAAGRRVLAREALQILTIELPDIVRSCLSADAHDIPAMTQHADTIEDQQALRKQLAEKKLVAFVAEGAILARRSGVDDRPLSSAVPFAPVPPSMRVTFTLPNAGSVVGLGVPEGITLIVGGGYHGKSTLLEALARGIYDHIPGDGRELVVTRQKGVCVRAEDGRSIKKVSIDAFIRDLPNAVDTAQFSTERASGSTSQAASIMEALEAGTDLFLIDEDTSASNFLGRDHRMQLLVPPEQEPICPFVDRVRQLYAETGTSTVLVLGGSSDYFEVAHQVLQMDAYRPRDVTPSVRDIVAKVPSSRRSEGNPDPIRLRPRIPRRASLSPQRQGKPGRNRVRALDTRAIRLGDQEIDLTLVAQLVHPSQTRALGDALVYVYEQLADDQRSLRDIILALEARLRTDGLWAFAAARHGDRAGVRAIDVAIALNRLRTLVILDPKSR